MQRVSAIMPDNNLAAPSAGNADNTKVSNDFQKIMTDMKSTGNKASDPGGKVSVRKKDVSGNQSAAYDNAKDTAQQISQNSPQKPDTGKTEAFTKNDFLQVQDEVKAVVQDVLGLDEDAFAQTMASMGITAIQLLDPEVLQQFVVQLNGGTDATDLLTSDEMMQQFSELSASLLDADWEDLTGFTGQQLSEMTADQFADGEFLQSLMNPSDGDSVSGGMISGETGGAVAASEQQEISQMQILTPDNTNATAEEALSDAQTVSGETAENVNVQVVTENAGEAADLRQEDTKAVNDNVSLLSSVSGEKVSEADSGDLQQNAFQDGEQADSRADNMTTYFKDSPVVTAENPAIMNFAENMVQAANAEQVQEPVNMQQMIDIVNQVVERVHSSLQDETATLEMQLNPERLGKMLLSVSSKEGVMTASITVQNAEAKAALESQMITLRENLEQKNLKVEAVEVSVSDFAFSQSGQADTGDQKNFRQGDGKRSRFRFEADEEEGKSREETAQSIRRSVMPDSGSSIDFTA